MKLEMEIDIEKFRYSLVGDGYLYKEVTNMTEDELLEILKRRISTTIDKEYSRSKPIIIPYLMEETFKKDTHGDNVSAMIYGMKYLNK